MNAQQRLEWNDLQYVLAVCRAGTLSGAARVLGVNHSTVFRRISTIEKKLGVRLFERLASGYTMTEAGEAMLDSGERVENEMLALSRKLIGRDLQLSGVLRVAVPDALLLKILMPHLATFARRYPKIQLELVVSNQYLNLSKREADIAIRATREPPETAIARRMCSMMIGIYSATDYLNRQAGQTIENSTWLLPDDSLTQLPIIKWLDRHYPKAIVGLRCNTLLGLHEAVIHGFGVAALPCFLGDADARLVRMLPLTAELNTELWLLTHPDLRRTARVQVLMDFLTEVLEQEKNRIEGRLT